MAQNHPEHAQGHGLPAYGWPGSLFSALRRSGAEQLDRLESQQPKPQRNPNLRVVRARPYGLARSVGRTPDLREAQPRRSLRPQELPADAQSTCLDRSDDEL